MKIKVSTVLKKLLTIKQLKLLKAYLANYTIGEIVRKLKVKQSEVLLEFIFLGKKLLLYDLIETRIVPNLSKLGKSYMDGFLDFKNQLSRVVKKNERIEKGKSRPSKKRRKKARS